MYYYKLNDNFLLSRYKIYDLEEISYDFFKNNSNFLFYLNKLDENISRFSFSLTDPSLLYIEKEDINLLNKANVKFDLDDWLLNKIYDKKIKSININFPYWKEEIKIFNKSKYRVNIFALGDVGSTLLTGLKLLGGDCIYEIGIYDRNSKKIDRYEHELNQIIDINNPDRFPKVINLDKSDLFNCDMFVFCASKGVPPVGSEAKDVRMVQFKENSKIIAEYAKLARKNNFKGIFAVISDPVDLLCKVAYIKSNENDNGKFDFLGLKPEQIRGYGLGVMNARAVYHAKKNNIKDYKYDGRAYGPHGEGLIIANSIKNYDENLSDFLTKITKEDNLSVRELGYKPFIAPAISSGTLSIIATLKGEWNYSSTYIGGVYFGSKNRLTITGTELERLNLTKDLLKKLKITYERLKEII